MLADIIKIHCLVHHANFPMPRTSRAVVCRESAQAHTLSSNFPYDGAWVYCCNCQTFLACDKNQIGVSIKECPFCLSSLNPRAYSCDRCAVTMVDFDDQTLRKHHAVLEWGAPQPACAGCHQFPHANPKKHFCQTTQCEISTARAECSFCGISAETNSLPPSQIVTASLDAALAEAEAKAVEAEERRRLAEEAVRNEVKLRLQAEHKVDEIEKRATRELNQAKASNFESEMARREAEAAKALAEAEAKARAEAERLAQAAELQRQEAERRKAEAEARAREVEERHRQAEATVRREAKMRAQAEQQTREVAEQFTSQLAETEKKAKAVAKGVKKDRVAIALTTAIAVILTIALIILIVTLILYLR